ncbi:MAG: glycosyltransferase family 4 protein [Chloroflexi bacterium]|nr:glycosyltransferase family 4 protein [Chloroflexota bacterium]
MKLLFLTNFYPPASRGGYEQWCQEVTDGLRSRGHDVLVLTSTHGRGSLPEPDPAWVRRGLHLEMEFASLRNAFHFFTSRKRRERENLTLLRQTVETHRPEAILLWGMWNFLRSLPALAEELLPGRVAYYVGDYWLTLPSQFANYWNAPARNPLTGLPKLLLRPFARRILAREPRPVLKVEHALFPSAFMQAELQRKGVTPRHSKIIYGAIDTRPYLASQRTVLRSSLSLLYIGRLTREKGVHTAIEGVGHIVRHYGVENVKLTVIGDGDADYVRTLREFVARARLASFVDFLPAQPKEALPSLYPRFDILIFPSIWAEPFGRVIVEAMASGVVVVGTAVGGAAEILADGENALTFPPNEPEALSRQLKRLIDSPSLRERLAEKARQTAAEKFDLLRMTAGIESYLQGIAQ